MNHKRWFALFLSLLLTFSLVPIKSYAETTTPQIMAGAAILMDADTKTVLYEKNAYDQHYPASITKLMTALLAIENLSLDEEITFSTDAIYSIEPGSSHIGIKVGEILTVEQALHGLLLMSANEVANGLAEAVSGSLDDFAVAMTERAKELGALNTHFMNAHGLHDENHYTTAYDMALIGSYLAKNETFLSIMQDTTYNIPETNITDEVRYLYQQHAMLNPTRNPKIYREDVIGGKTGYTDQARHTLVTMAKQGDTTLVAVVLQSEKSTLYSDTASLFDFGFNAYKSLDLHTSDDILKTAPSYAVKSGQAYQYANFGLGVDENISLVVANAVQPDDIELTFDLPESLNGAYELGDVVGSVSFVLDGQTLKKSDLVIKQIDLLPEPSLSFFNTSNASLFKVILIGIVISIILIILLILRKKHLKNKYRKIDKYFK